MARRKPHDGLPRCRRVTRLYVIVDQACVARRGVKSLSQIFKEDPHKHCADRETNYCQPICRGQLLGYILCCACVRHHRKHRLRIQRNFEPLERQVETWRTMQITDDAAKFILYSAFIDGKLEAHRSLLPEVHRLYFEPRFE